MHEGACARKEGGGSEGAEENSRQTAPGSTELHVGLSILIPEIMP